MTTLAEVNEFLGINLEPMDFEFIGFVKPEEDGNGIIGWGDAEGVLQTVAILLREHIDSLIVGFRK